MTINRHSRSKQLHRVSKTRQLWQVVVSTNTTSVQFQKWYAYSISLSLHFYLLYLLLNSCNGNDAKSLLNSCCAVGRRSPSRHWWLQQLFQSSAALNDFSLTQNWKLTANTTMKFCWRSRRCQLCGALLATRLCSSKTVHLRTTLVKQYSPLSRKHRILCLQIRGRQTFIHSFIHFTIHIKTKLYSI